jgi:hypothetical protein
MERWRQDQPDPPGAYARELEALVACNGEEWDQVAEEQRKLAVEWIHKYYPERVQAAEERGEL